MVMAVGVAGTTFEMRKYTLSVAVQVPCVTVHLYQPDVLAVMLEVVNPLLHKYVANPLVALMVVDVAQTIMESNPPFNEKLHWVLLTIGC